MSKSHLNKRRLSKGKQLQVDVTAGRNEKIMKGDKMGCRCTSPGKRHLLACDIYVVYTGGMKSFLRVSPLLDSLYSLSGSDVSPSPFAHISAHKIAIIQ